MEKQIVPNYNLHYAVYDAWTGDMISEEEINTGLNFLGEKVVCIESFGPGEISAILENGNDITFSPEEQVVYVSCTAAVSDTISKIGDQYIDSIATLNNSSVDTTGEEPSSGVSIRLNRSGYDKLVSTWKEHAPSLFEASE